MSLFDLFDSFIDFIKDKLNIDDENTSPSKPAASSNNSNSSAPPTPASFPRPQPASTTTPSAFQHDTPNPFTNPNPSVQQPTHIQPPSPFVAQTTLSVEQVPPLLPPKPATFTSVSSPISKPQQVPTSQPVSPKPQFSQPTPKLLNEDPYLDFEVITFRPCFFSIIF